MAAIEIPRQREEGDETDGLRWNFGSGPGLEVVAHLQSFSTLAKGLKTMKWCRKPLILSRANP
jgi:hypothetical protein